MGTNLRIAAALILLVAMAACGGWGPSTTTAPPPRADFSISISPATFPVALGGTNEIQITDAPVNGFAGNVSLNLNGLPAGVTTNPALPAQLGATGLTLSFSAASTAAAGTYPLTLVGTSGNLQHSATAQLTLGNRANLSLVGPSGTVQITQATSDPVSIAVVGDGGIVDFSVDLQAVGSGGITATFSNAVVSPNANVTLTLTASPTALIGPGSMILDATRSIDGVEFSTTLPINVAPEPTIRGNIMEFAVPTANAGPSAIVRGPDLAMWFSEENANQLGRIALDGSFSEYPVPTQNAGIGGIATGTDGNLYFTEAKASKVASFNPGSTQFTEWDTPVAAAGPGGIVSAPDGALWIMGASIDTLFQLTTQGTFLTSLALKSGCYPHGPVIGSDGNIWFACITANQIARVTPQEVVTYFDLPNAASLPTILTSGADGNIYLTEQAGRVAEFNLNTLTFTEWTVPTPNSTPYGIGSVANNICFTERSASKIGCMPDGGGNIVEYPTPTSSATPAKMALGPDGRLWFTEQGANNIGQLN